MLLKPKIAVRYSPLLERVSNLLAIHISHDSMKSNGDSSF